jgi:phosphoadenosine phosphosulfate reductase
MTVTVSRSPAVLARVAAKAERELADATAVEILQWAAKEFGTGFVVTASMQDTVLAHLASKVAPGVEVIFLDTGYHFVETLGTADAVEAFYDITLRRVTPELTVIQQDLQYGPRLYARDPDKCCEMRKVIPLNKALTGYEAWATGVRRAESPTRANTRVVEFNERRGKVKISPLAAWSDDDVLDYATANGVLMNPLLQLGYPSIGCEPCTAPVAPGENARAGRWATLTKTECGINI